MDRNYRVNTHNKTISRISTNDRDDRDQNRLWSLPLPVLINRANRWLNASIFGQNREESQCILPVLLLIGISRRSKLIFTGQGLSKACFPHRHARESVHTVINLNARSSSPPLPTIIADTNCAWRWLKSIYQLPRREFARERDFLVYTRKTDLSMICSENSRFFAWKNTQETLEASFTRKSNSKYVRAPSMSNFYSFLFSIE